MIGQTLAHYRILEKLGSGGMGEVYVAEDTKLSRKVALKVLPEEMATGERLSRFKREAKAIAALNHPNIVTVYSVEEAEGVHFITMELVRGKTLSELLPKHGFPLSKFFDVAIPLSDAVAAAHQERITHRDLKPDNAMVGEDGRVKVLDFGLAKPAGGFAVTGASSELPTQAKTQEGAIVGTLNYMSPEQAAGKAVDPRSDIFSLGIVFYEMLTGRRPFGGDTPAEVLSSVIGETPRPVQELREDVPRELSKLVQRCLAKEPTRRAQNALDIRNELEELKQDVASGELGAAPVGAKSHAPIVSLALVAILAAAGVTFLLLPEGDPIPRLTNPVQITSAIGVEDYPTWSPDGRTLAYTAMESERYGTRSDIWVVSLGGGASVNRTADHPGHDMAPSWSPDGSQIAFYSNRDGRGYFVMSAVGGAVRKIISDGQVNNSPQWSADGEELAGISRGPDDSVVVQIVSLNTRESRRAILQGKIRQRDGLSWSPDGRFFAYVVGHTENEVHTLRVLRLADGQNIAVTDGMTQVGSPNWSSDGRFLYFVSNRGGNWDLWQQRMGSNGTPDGDPRPVTVGVGMRHAAFSPDGTKLAYSQGRLVANVWRVPILEDRPATWADAEQITFDQAFIEWVDVSPDASRLLVSSNRGGNMDLWMLPLDGGDMTQVTTDPAPDWAPRWSPDGEEVVFYSYRTGNRDVWVMPLSGGPARQLTDAQATGWEAWGPTWSPDGRDIAFARWVEEGIHIIPSAGGEPHYLAPGGAPDWSPDGEWIVTGGNPGPLLLPASGGDPEPLTGGHGEVPKWSLDGKQVIFFRGQGEDLRTVSLADRIERPLTDLTDKRGTLGYPALSTDGRYVYFAWMEDLGDIWVMDVVED